MSIWYSKPPPGTPIDEGWKQDFGCVGLWLMNEGGGGKIYNLADQSRQTDGTLTGGVTWTGGKFGSALSFDGTNDYVSIANNNALNPTNITVCVWFNVAAGGASELKSLVLKSYTSHVAPHYQYGIRVIDKDAAVRTVGGTVTVGGTSYNIDSAGIAWEYNKWHNAVITYDGETLLLYINGVLIGSNTTMSGNMSNYATSLWFGAYSNLALNSAYCYGGALGSVYIYNKALPASEIQRLYATPFSMFPKRSPILYFDLGGGTTYEVSLSLGGIGGITQTNIATLNSSVEVAGVSGMTDTNIATFLHSLSLGAVGDITESNVAALVNALSINAKGDIAHTNIADLINSLSLAGIGGITEEQIVTILGNIAIEAKSGMTESNIATLLNAVSLGAVGDISQTDILAILGALSLNGISDVSFSNIGTLLNSLLLDATAGITESNIATLLNTLNLDSVDAITLTNIATLYNELGFTSIDDIIFSLGNLFQESLSLDATADITESNIASFIDSLPLITTADITESNIATLLNALNLNSIDAMAISNIATVYNSLGLGANVTITFPFGNLFEESVTFGSIGNINIVNVAIIQSTLTLSQIAVLATWGVLIGEKLRILAVTAKGLYCIGVDTKQLYEISVEAKP